MRERIIRWTPAYDKRNPDPSKNYGIGSVGLRFILKGETAATQFVMFTGWFTHAVREEHRIRPYSGLMGADVGYHSTVPLYEDHSSYECDLFPPRCYYDGSGLRAESLLERFIEEGDEVVWKELDEYLTEIESRQLQPEPTP